MLGGGVTIRIWGPRLHPGPNSLDSSCTDDQDGARSGWVLLAPVRRCELAPRWLAWLEQVAVLRWWSLPARSPPPGRWPWVNCRLVGATGSPPSRRRPAAQTAAGP